MIDTDVLTMKHIDIDIPVDDSRLVVNEEDFEVIVVNASRRVRRHFGIVDLWNVRRKINRLRTYR